MNNRGQSLIMFVLILPLISMFIAFFIDSSLSLMEKNRLDGIITSNMKEVLNKDIHDEDIIRNVIKKNEDMDVLVSIVEDDLHIIAKSNKKSIFGKILNFKFYQLDFHYCANYSDKKINKKCG